MGILIDGIWHVKPPVTNISKDGSFVRVESQFRDSISADPNSKFPAEPNRYHLYISYACPWACRTLIMRVVKGLEDVISYSVVDAYMSDDGWSFGKEGKITIDPLYNKKFLREIYVLANPKYSGKVTVPVLWDKKNHTIVNNESAEIMLMLNNEFSKYAKKQADYYPKALQPEIDSINDFVYKNINNGVYRCGFAASQSAYDQAFDELFSALDKIENLLTKQKFLVGDQITIADWRLFTTIVRHDPVYYSLFKCNYKRMHDYPHLSQYLQRLIAWPGIAATINMDHIKRHYYQSLTQLNPNGIVPKGPLLDY